MSSSQAERRRLRYANDPIYRARVLAKNKANPKKSLYARANKLKARYGISITTYNILLEQQEGRCAICHQYETRVNRDGEVVNLSVDHNHETGEVRALLCHECNVLIGACRENPQTLQSAMEYLDNYK